jgi:Zn-dependent metalloprotease
MATTKDRKALCFITAVLAAGCLYAEIPQESLRVATAADHLMTNRTQLGLDSDHAFQLRESHTDHLGQTHGHFAQKYKGLKVWGGDAITHTDRNGAELPLTNALHKNIRMNVTPSLSTGEALAVSHRDLAPRGSYAYVPTTDLLIYPETTAVVRRAKGVSPSQELNATEVTHEVVRFALAYHIHTELENKLDGIRHTDYIVDAHTGAILKKWDTLHTTAATGTGNSQYNGIVSLDTNSTTTGFELRDMTRGTGGNYVTNAAHTATTSTAVGTIYTNTTNTWGDGTNYVEGSSTTAANGQTAAVDAMFGMAKSWDFYKNVYGRNGIDGAGTATYSRVHIGNAYDNAFWSDSCFCMTYGDGTSFTTLTALDVAGHEMSHGVCARTANLAYSGESGGLNESNSDIFGTMIEFYARGGSGATIGNSGGNWTIGEQLSTTPLRYMYKPSLDGASPDAWSSTVGSLDVHYSSGPMNRCFYFLSVGATTTGNTSSTYLPSGMTGIGNDKASAIWFRALTTYLTSSSNYAAARTAAISAAKDLYTAGSPEEQAVWNAFHGINVGAAWSSTPPPPPSTFTEVEANDTIATANVVAKTFTAIQGNLTVATDKDFFALSLTPGQTLAIAMTGPTGVDWDLKLVNAAGTQLAISQGSTATENISYTNTGTTATTVYANVYAYSGVSTTPYNLALTYSGGTTPPPADTTAPIATATETGTSGTITLAATATDNVGVTKVEFYIDGALVGTDTTSPYSVTYNSALLTNGTHSLVAKAYDAAGNIGSSTAASFTVSNTSTGTTFNEVESNNSLATANVILDNVTKIVGYMGSTTDIDYFKLNVLPGKSITVNMTGPSGVDYDLYFLNSSGTTLKSSLGSTATETITYANTSTTATVFYIKVIAYAGSSTTTPYNLALTR